MHDTPDSDQRLVERAQRGDHAAFNCLVAKYQQRLLNLVSCMVHDRHDAKDVVQATLLSAYRGLPAFRGDAAFYTWLQAIAHNCARTLLRSRKRAFSPHSALAVDDDADAAAPHEHIDPATPENLLECREVAALVARAVAQMRIDLTLALTLHEDHGLSYDQIAHVMATPVGTVRRHIHEARKHIARRIAGATAAPPQR